MLVVNVLMLVLVHEMITYSNKAVMEIHSKNAGDNGLVSVELGFHYIRDDGFCTRANVVVKSYCQPFGATRLQQCDAD